MRFCTVINCIDGRVQLPVIKYLQKRFNIEYVDSITEAAPSLILSDEKNTVLIQSILKKLKISIENHKSVGIAIVAHYGCAANVEPKEDQILNIKKSIQSLHQNYENTEIIGLWVDKNWKVNEII